MPGEDIAQRRGFIITLCVLIAVVLWLTLSIGETYTILVEMETQVVNVPPDTALAALPPARVQVQVRGEGEALPTLPDAPVFGPTQQGATRVGPDLQGRYVQSTQFSTRRRKFFAAWNRVIASRPRGNRTEIGTSKNVNAESLFWVEIPVRRRPGRSLGRLALTSR